MGIVTEIVKMQTNGNISKVDFIAVIDDLERDFHSRQPGFMNTELLHDEKADIWYMIQHWASVDHMKASSAQMFKSDLTLAFRNAINPKEISITVLPQLKTW